MFKHDLSPQPAETAKPKPPAEKRFSRTHRPEDMSLEQWQTALRRQFGPEQKFRIKNVGDQKVFSHFRILNPQNGNTYRVAIRGERPGENFCSCPDFTTNALGTCKHIEFALSRLRRVRGAAAALRQGFHPPYSEIFLQYGARRQVRFRQGLDCPPALQRLARKHFDDDGVLPPSAFGGFQEFLAQASAVGHELRCHEDVLSFIAEVHDRDRRKEVVNRAFPSGIHSAGFKNLLKVDLYDYQKEGALFAARAGRCLIGDEMGLGKTIQAIAAAQIMAKHLGVERVLVICPTSLKHQWERELDRFTDRSKTVISGLRARREEAYKTESFYKITNYETVHRDLDLIQAWSPDLVVLDEAQRIKNWSTRTARSVKKVISPYAIVLTGTPLENRLEELVSIVQFVDQHRLGPTFRFLADHQMLDEDGKVVGYRGLDHISQTLSPILIRRRKMQVLKQLPPRLEKHFFVPMTPQQMRHHDENREVVARLVAKWRRYRFLSEADQRRLMIALQNMRMSCDSTYLLDHETDFGTKADELATLLGEILEQPDAKVVVFSQWLRMHELLERRLRQRQCDYVLFHGGVETSHRKQLIDRFREDDRCRAFLSTDAGGVGLNLQHASVVVNMDIPWNPAVLEQRIGRVHRLGQSRAVRVVNFVAQGTIEQGMLSLLKFKSSLAAGILDSGQPEVFLGGSRLKRFMESVETATTKIPAPAVEEQPADTAPERPVSDREAEAEASPQRPPRAAAPSPAGAPAAATDPWAGLLQGGLSLLEQLAAGARGGAAPSAGPAVSLVRRDESTGESYLRLPMPSPEVLDRAITAIAGLLDRFRK